MALSSSDPNKKGSAAWKALRLRILARDKRRCYMCLGPANEVDHMIPRSEGGPSHPANLRAICRPCHVEKSKAERRGLF